MRPETGAFTRIELVTVTLMVALLAAAVLLPAFSRMRQRAWRIQCVKNLQQIGLNVRTWALDHGDRMPSEVDARFGGSLESIAPGEAFRHFQVLFNELKSPAVVVCPSDVRRAAKDFGAGFSNTNLSYFMAVDAQDTNPELFLSGDRNLTNGLPIRNGLLELDTAHPLGWTHEMHNRQGNVALADGSVQGISSSKLGEMFKNSGLGTNRLAMP
jgi:prepilin-type processing-associated H-X9-DG protein